jgi:transcriptional regulator with XRE-family HTH domain
MTQEQLALRAGIAVSTVRKIETGVVIEPGYFTVLSLLHALEIDDGPPDNSPPP